MLVLTIVLLIAALVGLCFIDYVPPFDPPRSPLTVRPS